jgi:hypothetical protein
MAQTIETAPLLSRLSRAGLLRDVLAGTALIASLLLLWGWFLLAVARPPRAPQAQERAVAVVERAGRTG